ncbi:DUF421 domain-containing protein [Parafrankia elaeagni]|uniref:DUF421 domain-containing protein n=1 Tax=Parafrankia elaeagni TaxID=222534 RepID=UPI00035E0AB3|nr:YetF domain-containing protein [Parafrankia elaeagni]
MEIVYRAAFMFAFLWLITRVVGRSTLGELSTFQLLLYVTMGDLVQQAVTQQDYSITSGVLAVSVFALLTIALTAANARWPAVRSVTHGIPVVVVHNGEPLLDMMRREQLSLDDLMAAAREQGIERFGAIRLAVFEADGRISFFTGDSPVDPASPDGPGSTGGSSGTGGGDGASGAPERPPAGA